MNRARITGPVVQALQFELGKLTVSAVRVRMLSNLVNVDTQLSRLGGPNFHEIPINKAVCPVHNMNRDGFHRQTIAQGRVNYEPSAIDAAPIMEVPVTRGGFASYTQLLTSAKLRQRVRAMPGHAFQPSADSG